MVEPLRVTPLVEIVATQQMRTLFHGGIELDLKAEWVGELQGAALEGLFGKGISHAVFRKERRGLVEIAVIADLEAQAVAGRGRRLAQHQRVVLMLLATAQVHRFIVAILDMQPDSVLVELPTGVQIRDIKHSMAAPNDIKRGVEDVLRDRHTVSLLVKSLSSS